MAELKRSAEEMNRAAIISLRSVLVTDACCLIWNVATGSMAHPFHPLILTGNVALVVAVFCVWIAQPWALLAASIAGVATALVGLLEYGLIRWMISVPGAKAHFRCSLGPVEFEGRAADFAAIGPEVLLLVSSFLILWQTADKCDRAKKEPIQPSQPTSLTRRG